MQKKINFTIALATFMLLAFSTVTASATKSGALLHQPAQTAAAASSVQTQTAWEGGGLPPVKVPYRALSSSTVAEGGGLPPMKKPVQSAEGGGLPPMKKPARLTVAEGGGLPPMKKPVQSAEGGGLPPMKKPVQNPQVLG